MVVEAFPALSGLIFVKRLASPVPLVPDTTFDVFNDQSGNFFALVTTDYPDPLDQGREFGVLSRRLEFADLVAPYDVGETITILEHDDMDRAFAVREGCNHYYLANLKNSERPNISA